MLGHSQNHELLRKYVIVFGNLFSDIYINRATSDGTRKQTIGVPIQYGPREKWLTAIQQNPSFQTPRAVNSVLPRMGFEMVSFAYDPARATPAINRVSKSDSDSAAYVYQPQPWNFTFKLSVFARNARDGAQIVEQIIPYFTPEWVVPSVEIVGDVDLVKDIPIILNSATPNDVYDGDFETRRSLMWDFDFTLKGWLVGPVKKSGVIKRVQVDTAIVSDITSDDYAVNMQTVTTPGLTEAGTPTTDSTESIPYSEIESTDDYGFAFDVFE